MNAFLIFLKGVSCCKTCVNDDFINELYDAEILSPRRKHNRTRNKHISISCGKTEPINTIESFESFTVGQPFNLMSKSPIKEKKYKEDSMNSSTNKKNIIEDDKVIHLKKVWYNKDKESSVKERKRTMSPKKNYK